MSKLALVFFMLLSTNTFAEDVCVIVAGPEIGNANYGTVMIDCTDEIDSSSTRVYLG